MMTLVRWVFSTARAASLLRFSFVCLLLLVGMYSLRADHALRVVASMKVPNGSAAAIYYALQGQGFLEEQKLFLERGDDDADGNGTFEAVIRTRAPVHALRFDPADQKGPVALAALTMEGRSGVERWSGEEVASRMMEPRQLAGLSLQGGYLVAESTGDDPNITLPAPLKIQTLTRADKWQAAGLTLGYAAGLAMLLEWLIRCAGLFRRAAGRLNGRLDVLAGKISDDDVIVWRRSSLQVLLVIVLGASLAVALKIHQSSIGMWETMHPPQNVEQLVDLGTPKAIRTDEWNTFTPWMLSQVRLGMPSANPGIGPEGAPLLTGSPVMGPLMVAQPKFWGFLLLDVERGFSWFWAFKSFGLVAAVFVLMLALTRGHTAVSLAAAVSIYGSSYVQWWYSSVPPEIISGVCVALVGTLYLFQSRKTWGMAAGALMLSMAVPNLIQHLYPPYLLPFVYLCLFLLAALLVNRQAWARLCVRWPTRAAFMAGVLVVWLVLGYLWYQAAHETIEVMLNTSYPGRRFAMGGEMPYAHVFYGIFESWQFHEFSTPFPPANPSEASNLWMLFPVVLLLVPKGAWRDTHWRVPLALLAFCMLELLWVAGPLPGWVRTVLAHAGWYMVPSARGLLGMGVASIMLVAVVVSGVHRGQLQLRTRQAPLVAGFAMVVVMAYWWVLHRMDPEFFADWRMLAAAAGVGGLVLAMVTGATRLYVLVSLLVVIPPLHVNPLQSGLDFYLNKRPFVQAREASDDQAVWAVYGSLFVAQGLKGAGLTVVNGTIYAPKMNMIRALDPQLRYGDVWNRYAHIELLQGKPGAPPLFKTHYADHYSIALDVCGQHIRDLGVTHIAMTREASAHERTCLQVIREDDHSEVDLYRLLPR